MDSTDVIAGVGAFGGKWVSLACDSERFDIDSGRVGCQYTVAEYTAAVDGSAVIVVPAAFRCVSQMVAHVVLPGGGRGHAELTVRRWAVRCARPYRFAYVDGRRYEVLGVSDEFAFVHCSGGPCDCDADFRMELPTAVLQTDDHRTTDQTMSAFVSALMDTRSSACLVCNVPSNHRQVLEYLTTNIDRLSDVYSNINTNHIKYTRIHTNINRCTITEWLLKCYYINILYSHMGTNLIVATQYIMVAGSLLWTTSGGGARSGFWTTSEVN